MKGGTFLVGKSLSISCLNLLKSCPKACWEASEKEKSSPLIGAFAWYGITKGKSYIPGHITYNRMHIYLEVKSKISVKNDNKTQTRRVIDSSILWKWFQENRPWCNVTSKKLIISWTYHFPCINSSLFTKHFRQSRDLNKK